MAYLPYPIYDMRAGKVTEKEAWLLPKDAFETLRNCHLKKGVLEKRKGYSLFGQMCHIATAAKTPTLKTDPVMGLWNWYSGSTEELLAMDKARFCKFVTSRPTGKTITAFADYSGTVAGTVLCTAATHGFTTDDIVTISGTTSYNGTFKVTKVNANTFYFTDTWVANDATGTASQEPFLDLTRHSIRFKHASKQNWSPAVGEVVEGATSGAYGTVEEVIVNSGTMAGNDACGTIIFANGTITGTFDETSEELFERGTASNKVGNCIATGTDDENTGDNTNFIWVENWKEIAYITNDNNILQTYNGSNLSRHYIDLDVEGGPDNDVTRVKFMFTIKSHLVIFELTERATAYRQRARWCEVNDPKTWKDANYVDAPTDEWIIAADFIGNVLIVWFERSVWSFDYTGDPDLPFVWDRIDSVEGCYAPMSLVSFSDEIFGVGPTRLVGTDGRETYGVDKKIPDFMLSWVQASVGYSYGLVLEETAQALISYASNDASAHADGNTYPDSAIVLNYEDNCFSTYELPIHCLGYSALESDQKWSDISEAWSAIDYKWNEKSLQSGYPTTLMGSQDGKVYRLNDGNDDDGSAIAFRAVGGQWSPYVEDGKEADLGFIDFIVDVSATATFDVKCYLNTDSTAWQTITIDCMAIDGSDDLVTKRLDVYAIANFHRIEIGNDAAGNRPRIHAIIPYFQEGGAVH